MIIDVTSESNLQDNSGISPLHLAAKLGYQEISKLILKKTESLAINPEDKSGKTPLDLAFENGNFDIFQMILRENPMDKNGKTPLHQAAENGNLDLCKQIGPLSIWYKG